MSNNNQQNQSPPQAVQPQSLVPIDTSSQVNALVPQSLDGAMQFAEWLAKSSLLPKAVNKVHDIFFILCAGMELGLPPMAALRGLYTVNGRTALESKTKMSLCLQKRAAQYFKRIEYTPEATTWETLRHGSTEPVRMRYTRQEAIDSGLAPGRPTGSRADAPPMAGKEGPWRQYTQRMISHRALGWLCDDVYADVVMGVATAEDFDPREFTFVPVGAGVELGTPNQLAAPEVTSAPPAAAKNANAAEPKTEYPKDTAKQGDGSRAGSKKPEPEGPVLDNEDEIADFIERIGTFTSEPDLKEWVEKNIKTRKMTDAIRDKFATAYADQRDLIRDAAKAEKAGQ
jgi:hypothetical protein